MIRKIDKNATLTALLPKILQRGTDKYPNSILLEKELENNFGSRLSARSRKIGEHHLIEFALHMPCKKYLGLKNADQVYQKGIALLQEVLLNPYLESGVFKNEYVEQEKNVLRQEIESTYNNKEEWAMQRCIEISCKNEPYAIPAYGRIEDLKNINAETLTEFYYQTISSSPTEIFIVGDLDGDEIIGFVKDTLKWTKKESSEIEISSTVDNFPTEIKTVTEIDKVNQGKLVISLRSKIGPCSRLLPAELLYNSILGGGTHSKLFKSVREKHSLAYYAHSSIERNKKMLFIEAGIDKLNYQQTIEIVKQDLTDMREGKVSEREIERAKTTLINSLWTLQDYSGGNIDYYLVGLLTGCSYSSGDMEKHLYQVSHEDIVEVAHQIAIDTVYFLCAPEEVKDEENL